VKTYIGQYRAFKIINYKNCNIKNLEHFKSVTTMADECKPVEQSLSLPEAHSIVDNNEEIV
jgi:hypothetical protein